MKIHSIPVSDIEIPPNRQRREFNPDKLMELAASIDSSGLIHPIVVRKSNGQTLLVAGERRLRSLEYIWNFGGTLRCGTQVFVEGQAPCLYLGEIDSLDAFEIELEENIRREDISWQDRSRATSQLMELRRLQSEKAGTTPPTIASIAEELKPDDNTSRPHAQNKVKRDLILARHLDDEDVQKAKTADEGFKILIRKEAARKNAELSLTIGETFSSSKHTLLRGDCLEILKTLPESHFDIILTDPPYGINAQDFNDSGGKTPGDHLYDDSPTEWRRLMEPFALAISRVTKPQSHAYIFCDVEMFIQLKVYMTIAGWNCFRTPLIWHNPQGMRAPWPENGPQRKWQMCLFAIRGKKPVTRLASDVLTFPSDENLGHAAQKPVALFEELLKRSGRPGEYVLDPFCGSGPVFPSAHSLQLYATGIEIDPAACGISAQRIKDLK